MTIIYLRRVVIQLRKITGIRGWFAPKNGDQSGETWVEAIRPRSDHLNSHENHGKNMGK